MQERFVDMPDGLLDLCDELKTANGSPSTPNSSAKRPTTRSYA